MRNPKKVWPDVGLDRAMLYDSQCIELGTGFAPVPKSEVFSSVGPALFVPSQDGRYCGVAGCWRRFLGWGGEGLMPKAD